jgi:Helix-turn-helix domain
MPAMTVYARLIEEASTMLLAHKIALEPTTAQRWYFARAAGTARFAWNWALAEWRRQYQAGGKPSDVSLRRELNKLKREQFPWMYDVTKAAVQEAVIDLGRIGHCSRSVPSFPASSVRTIGRLSVRPMRQARSGRMASGSGSRSSAGCACARPCGFLAR